MEERFEVEGKTVTVRQAGSGGPVVYLHVFEGGGQREWQECLGLGCDNFTLAAIGNLNWDDDMTPWDCPPLFEGDSPCGGKAQDQLARLTGSIMPQVEQLAGSPCYSAIAGYSLGGLFAAWSVLQTDAFAAMASVSGSMWFPRFVDYVAGRNAPPQLERAYFSLGDRESHTPNAVLRTVGDCTNRVVSCFREKNVQTVFEWNRGNHFKQEALRTAKGIRWLLDA